MTTTTEPLTAAAILARRHTLDNLQGQKRVNLGEALVAGKEGAAKALSVELAALGEQRASLDGMLQEALAQEAAAEAQRAQLATQHAMLQDRIDLATLYVEDLDRLAEIATAAGRLDALQEACYQARVASRMTELEGCVPGAIKWDQYLAPQHLQRWESPSEDRLAARGRYAAEAADLRAQLPSTAAKAHPPKSKRGS